MVTTTDMIAYWKMDESAGDMIDAHSSNDGNVTSVTQNVAGKINTAYSFDGNNDRVNVNSVVSNMKTNEGSIGGWMKTTNLTGAGLPTIFMFGDTNANEKLVFNIESSNLIVDLIINGSRKYLFQVSTTELTSNQWHFLTITHDGTIPRLYIDEVNQTLSYISEVDKTAWLNDASGIDNFNFGTSNWNNNGNIRFFDGQLDEWMMFTRALSDSDVSDLYNSGNGRAYPFKTIAQSTSVDFNNEIITGAKLTATFTGNTPALFMTANGSNFESISSGVIHTFSNTGTDLRWNASGTGTILTEIKIEDYH